MGVQPILSGREIWLDDAAATTANINSAAGATARTDGDDLWLPLLLQLKRCRRHLRLVH